MGKPTMWFPNRSATNRLVQAQERAGNLKFWIEVEEELFYLSSENKGVVAVKLICVLVCAYADCWFFHKATHF